MSEQNLNNTEEVKTEKVVKTPMERISSALESVKAFFTGQEKRYVLNPKRTELLKEINTRLAGLAVSEERANEIVEESKKFAGSRSVKWTNDMLEYVNPKVYAESELRDKIKEMQPSAERLVYELVLKVVENWEDKPVALPCPFMNCGCNTHIHTEKESDGLFHTGCRNPKHMAIKTTIGRETEAESISEWNRMIQNN